MTVSAQRRSFAVMKIEDVRRGFLEAFFCCFALVGCDVIDYHPYDTRIDGATDINATNIQRIETECREKENLCFAVISDTQRWYDETKAAVRSINAREDVDFVLHLGDLTDFGITKEFEWMERELKELHVPYVCLIGNHDCLGTGPDVFCKMYGATNFSFNAGRTHFVGLNTNAYEYDYSDAVPDFSFIRTDRSHVPEHVQRTVVMMHAHPFSDQFNNNVADFFQKELRQYPGLAFCLCGHEHHSRELDLFDDGIVYYRCGAAKTREYLLFTLTKEGMKYEKVAY